MKIKSILFSDNDLPINPNDHKPIEYFKMTTKIIKLTFTILFLIKKACFL